jgi:hypothetical protein
VCSRFFAAIVGGYVFSAITVSLLAATVPLSKTDSVLLAVCSSILVYASVFIWVFSVKALRKVYGILIVLSSCQALLLALIKGWL